MKRTKLYLFCGKGGVGKTTISSAFSISKALKGNKTLLISTDPAPSLSDLIDTEICNLTFIEIDPQKELENYIENAISFVKSNFNLEVFDKVEAFFRNMGSTPGAEEFALLERLSHLAFETFHNYNVVVIDTAPTGTTLQLLKNSLRAGEWLKELITQRKKAERLKSAAGEVFKEIPLQIENRLERLEKLSDLFISSGTFIPILLAEKLPIAETARLIKELESIGIQIDTLIVNRLLPENPADRFFQKRKHQERLYLEEIRRVFYPRRVITIPMKETDISSVKDLQDIAELLKDL